MPRIAKLLVQAMFGLGTGPRKIQGSARGGLCRRRRDPVFSWENLMIPRILARGRYIDNRLAGVRGGSRLL